MSAPSFQNRLWLSSVPLVRLDGVDLPNGIASGCIVSYGDKHVLLTVAHATGDQKKWAMQVRYELNLGTKMHSLGAMTFLAKASIQHPVVKNLDFAYVEIPTTLIAYRQEIEVPGPKIKSETPISIHATTFDEKPDSTTDYGFCGMVMPEKEVHFGQNYFSGELRVYEGLKYDRTEGEYYVFKLPFAHPGHEHFQGCSGAPILDDSGSIVALVCKGGIANNEIWGIAMKQFRSPMDILVCGGT